MLLQLNTRQVPPRDRADFWRDAMLRVLKTGLYVVPQGADPFDASVGVMACGPISLIEMKGTPYSATRRGPGEDGWVSLMFQLDGVGSITDHCRTARLVPGDMCVVPPDREIVASRLTAFDQLICNVRVEAIEEAIPHWRDLAAVTIPYGRRGVRPTADLLRFALAHSSELDAECRDRLAATALSLLANGLGRPGETQVTAQTGSLSRMASFHRERIDRHIREHLRDPELSVPSIASALGLSTRYVHKLYERDPAHVMQQAQVQRLRECQRDIACRGTRSISEIALSWGFNSPSHFSRAFKKHFGVRPSDV
jgi:AraC-like DNA-binding protein